MTLNGLSPILRTGAFDGSGWGTRCMDELAFQEHGPVRALIADSDRNGAADGNRTRVLSLGSFGSAIELPPHSFLL